MSEEQQITSIKEEHAKAMDQANGQIQNMISAISVHEAEKGALSQAVNELLQANIRLKAAITLLDNQGKEGFALRDQKIAQLGSEILDLKNRLTIANAVIAANTNLIPSDAQSESEADPD